MRRLAFREGGDEIGAIPTTYKIIKGKVGMYQLKHFEKLNEIGTIPTSFKKLFLGRLA